MKKHPSQIVIACVFLSAAPVMAMPGIGKCLYNHVTPLEEITRVETVYVSSGLRRDRCLDALKENCESICRREYDNERVFNTDCELSNANCN